VRALIVEDGNQRGVLAAARTLGAAGWEIGVAAPHRGLSARSRWTRRWHDVPPPTAGLEPFLDAVVAAERAGGYEVVFGGGDAEVLALSAGRASFGMALPLPPDDAVLRAFDKSALAEAAVAAGLAVPRVLAGSGDGDGNAVVVKERLHGDPSTGAAAHHRTPVVVAPEDVARRSAEIRSSGGAPVLQELVDGELLALVVVSDRDGTVVGAAQQRSARVWPRTAGVSVRARSEPVDVELLGCTARMLDDLGWFGLAQLQFIAPDHGAPRLIDFNGRFFGSLQLSVAAGLDLPRALEALARGRPMPVQQPARTGIRYQWLEGDLRRAWDERCGGLVPDVAGCLRFAPGATHSTWRPGDPWPAAALGLDLLRRGAAKVGHRTAGLARSAARLRRP
jgi:predicted ATP-grasp superfamily ATP-dependent carboligase